LQTRQYGGAALRRPLHGDFMASRSLLFRIFIVVPFICILISGCGYTLRGQTDAIPNNAILGDGTKTVKIKSVEQVTMFSWLPYVVRSALRDGINERGIARWSNGNTDYNINVNITNYSNTNDNNTSGASYLYTVSLSLELVVLDGHTNKQVGTSSTVSYTNSYQHESEETAVREIARECVRRALDNLQQRF